jgi:hypothetical protein
MERRKRYEMKCWRWAAIVLAATALDGARPAEPSAARKKANRCYGVRVESADSRSNRHGRRSVISASESPDLRIEVSLPEELSSLPVHVKLFTPRGRLYQVLQATADAESTSRAARSRRRSARDARALAALFPVAGTQITTFALFGEWRAEVYLDDDAAPCTRPLEFVIEP